MEPDLRIRQDDKYRLAGIADEPLADLSGAVSPPLHDGQLRLGDLVAIVTLFAIGVCAFQFFSTAGGTSVDVLMLLGGLIGVSFLFLAAQRLLCAEILVRRGQTEGIVCEHRRIKSSSAVKVLARYRAGGHVYEVATVKAAVHAMPVGQRVTIAYHIDRPHLSRIVGRWGKATPRAIAGVAVAFVCLALFYALQGCFAAW